MATVRQIRRRIRSVENTAKITKAMSMIAASKMRRAQEMAVRGRPYSDLIRSLLADVAAQPQDEDNPHPLMRRREIRSIEIVHITPDRGLTGGMNSNVNRSTAQFIVGQDAEASVIAVGRKGRDFMVRYGSNVRAVFTDLGDRPSITDVTPIARLVTEEYSQEYRSP